LFGEQVHIQIVCVCVGWVKMKETNEHGCLGII
jgi:hypothetical protein